MELDGDVSLYHSVTGQALMLNGTASAVWRLLDGRHDLDGIVGLLADAYRVDCATIRDDVQRVIAELTEHGFLQR